MKSEKNKMECRFQINLKHKKGQKLTDHTRNNGDFKIE